MLCVTLTRTTRDSLLEDHRALVAQGVRLVEWRLDALEREIDVAATVRARPGPIIVTFRRPEDGGFWRGEEACRRELLGAAIEAGAEHVDLEPDAAQAMPRRGATRRIVSCHDFERTPDDAELLAIQARLAACDADVVKIATMGRRAADALRMLRHARAAPQRTVGLVMGELGSASRVLASWAGAPWTYAAPDTGDPPAPGQLSVRVMREHYRYERIQPGMKVWAVIGDPIAHSLSPLAHNAALEAAGVNGAYAAFRVPPTDLSEFLQLAPELLSGLSVTIPHKEAILDVATDIDDVSRRTGAANTLLWDGRRIRAWNTDEPAAMAALHSVRGAASGLAAFESEGEWLAGKTALVLGAGGAAKAIVDGLSRAGAMVQLAARTRPRADELVAALGGQAIDWEERHDVRAEVVVNCTPLGMWPKIEDTPLEARALRPGIIVFDTVYNPRRTRLLREASAAGAMTVDGLEMFVRQAALQFEHFTGQQAPIDVMRGAVAGGIAI